MPFIDSPKTNEAITADGDTTGYLKVTSNASYYPGARVWMRDGTHSKEYVVTDLKSTDSIGLREYIEWWPNIADTGISSRPLPPNYGRSDLSEWKVANSARIFQQKTVVRVELSNITKVSLV